MLHQSVSPPHSVADSVASRLSAPKDKNCPFCNQAFTSSSLGRHLDLYIRLKNPKAPDGIHNVDEIRKMRQAITRRQARTSSLKKECSTPGSTPKPSATDRASPIAQSPSLNLLPGEMIRLKFNEPNWQSTGVINNLPPRSMSAVPQMRRQLSKHHHHRSEKGRQHRMLEDLDNGRAAELALKEVLRAVREASAHTLGVGLFDFDPYTLNFPALCLRILPAPSTLFSPTPFPTSESWSINPPGQKQFEALNKAVAERVRLYQMQQQQLSPAVDCAAANPSLPPSPYTEQHRKRLFSHLTDAYNHWRSLSEKQRYEAWQLEILRSYSRAEEARLKAESGLEAAQRQIEKLTAEKASHWIGLDNDRQASPPLSLHALTLPLGNVKDLVKRGMDIQSWDYERLVERWKTRLRNDRQQSSGLNAQRSLSSSSSRTNAASIGGNGASNISHPASASAPAFGTPASMLRNGTTQSNSLEEGSSEDDDADADADADVDVRDALEEQAPSIISLSSALPSATPTIAQPAPQRQMPQQHSRLPAWPQQTHRQPGHPPHFANHPANGASGLHGIDGLAMDGIEPHRNAYVDARLAMGMVRMAEDTFMVNGVGLNGRGRAGE